jgi:hypothetical protein
MSFSHAMNAPWFEAKAPATKAARLAALRPKPNFKSKSRLRARLGRFADERPTLVMFGMLALLALFVIGLWDVMGLLMPL